VSVHFSGRSGKLGEAGVNSFVWEEKPVSVHFSGRSGKLRGEAGVSSFFWEERQTEGRSRCQFIFLGGAAN
jgi:hypothetical protein